MNNQVLFAPIGGDRRISRFEDKRANRSATMGYHHISDSGAHSANSTNHCAVETGLLQAKQTRPHALRQPGEEQP